MKRTVTYKLKLKPTIAQKVKLSQWLGVCRFIYNHTLNLRIQTYEEKNVMVSKSELQLVVKKLAKEKEWIKSVQSQVAQDPLVRQELAYKAFFREIKKGKQHGKPKFAKKHKYNSFTFPQNVCLHENGKLWLPKFGEIGFYKGGRDVSSMEIRQAKVVKQVDGWFVCLTGYVESYHYHRNDNRIGIDLGVTNYLVTSDGEFHDNPKNTKRFKDRICLIQRSVSRKKKGSKRRKKLIIQLAKLHQKVANCRKDFQHKLSSLLVFENQGIGVEDLKFSNMMRSAKGTVEEPGKNVKQKAGLNRSLADVAGHQFFQMLEYKCNWYGREFVKVSPQYTSQTCPKCSHVDKSNRISQAQFECQSCKYEEHADLVGAINIKGRAFPSGDISGVTCEPEKPRL